MLMNLRCGYVCSVKLGGGQIVRKSSVCRVGATREKNVVGTKKLDEKGKGGTDGKDEKKADVDRLRKEKLVRDHLYLVDVIARQSNWLSSPHIEDVLQEGHIGLIYAANKFIPSSGTHFPTYASYWIRQAMARGLWKSHQMHLPHRKYQLAVKARKTCTLLTEKLARKPTSKELAKELGWDEQTTKNITNVMTFLDTLISLDSTLDDKGSTLMDIFAAAEKPDLTDEREAVKEFHRILDGTLKPREKEILSSSYGLGRGDKKTRKELARGLNVSEATITNTKTRAFKKLRAKEAELAPYLAIL